MRAYRIYLLNDTGRVIHGEDREAPDDSGALDAAASFTKSHDVEVWQSSRCIARLLKGGAFAPPVGAPVPPSPSLEGDDAQL